MSAEGDVLQDVLETVLLGLVKLRPAEDVKLLLDRKWALVVQRATLAELAAKFPGDP